MAPHRAVCLHLFVAWTCAACACAQRTAHLLPTACIASARRRYDEAWRALGEAKRRHATKHAYKPVDFQRLADATMARFPLPAGAPQQQAQQQAEEQARQGQERAEAAAEAAPGVHPVLDVAAVAAASAAAAQRAQAEGGSAGAPRLRPIFVVGLPRSGSTLAEQILARWVGGGGCGRRVRQLGQGGLCAEMACWAVLQAARSAPLAA